jgi:hypothetical protein
MQTTLLIQYLKTTGKTFVLACFFATAHLQATGQQAGINTVQEQFENYQLHHLQEKIFAHIDKSCYLAGERIWFKLYLVDAFLHKPLSLSKVAYAELCDKEGKPVWQTKIKIEEATGTGSILLPAAMASGHYRFRAYTQWMRNFSADFFYEQVLTIINTLKQTAGSDTVSVRDIAIHFFPEGGNMVAGLPVKMAFKLENSQAQNNSCKGFIINQQQDTVARFQTALFGMGHFSFTPQHGHQYKAVVQFDHTVLEKDLPPVAARGYTMEVTHTAGQQINIHVKASDEFNNSAVYLFAHSRQLVKAVRSATLQNGTAVFKLDAGDLADGISHFTLFNSNRQPVCERLYFKRPGKKLSLSLLANKQVYAPREKVALALSSANELQQPVAADLSIAVFLIDSLQTTHLPDISSYLMLSSELKGAIPNPQYYFDEANPGVDEAADNLMLTHGWRRFNWQNVLQPQAPAFEFVQEQEGLLIHGKLTDRRTGLPVAGIPAYITIPGQQYQFLNSSSGKNGLLQFSAADFWGAREVIVQAENQTKNLYSIEIAHPFAVVLPGNKLPPFSLSPTYKKELNARHIAMQVENTYNIEAKKKYRAGPATDSSAFYGIPTYSFYLDAYTRFNTMEEVLREYITDVRVRKKNDDFFMQVLDRPTLTYFDNSPLVLIDGLPVFDINKIMAFNPLNIRSAQVFSKRYYRGPAVFDGIVSFSTYEGNLAGYELDAGSVLVKFEGLQQQREFYSPAYETASSKANRLPDLRNLLYWDPALHNGATGTSNSNFYTSDFTGKFAIMVQGITKDGRAGSSTIIVEVK